MKKTLNLVILLILVIGAKAQNCKIKGVVENAKEIGVKIYTSDLGIIETSLNERGEFYYEMDIERVNRCNMVIDHKGIAVYLAPGFDLDLKIKIGDKAEVEYSGKGAKESKYYYYQRNTLFDQSNLIRNNPYLSKETQAAITDDQLEYNLKVLDIAAKDFLYPEVKEIEAYELKSLNIILNINAEPVAKQFERLGIDANKPLVYANSSNYQTVIQSYYMDVVDKDKTDYMSFINKNVDNFDMKEAILSKYACDGIYHPFYGLRKQRNLVYSHYQKFAKKPSEIAKVERMYKSIAMFNRGSKFLGFTGKDVKGNEVSYEKYKGKYLLIDFWASWCKPCRAEVPHLKKLKEAYEGKNIEFLGISFDDSEKAWKKALEQLELSDKNQIIMGSRSEIKSYYKITGIPRFMIIDPNGNLYEGKAPFPSNPQLKEILDTIKGL